MNAAACTKFISRWFVDVPMDVVKERLVMRHIAAGIEPNRELASRRVEDNDIPNGDFIRSKLIKPNVTILN
jgi:pantothenate kinase